MSAADAEPILTVRGPADLVCAVPYLLGFHPEHSLVLVGMADGRVVVTVRADLPGLAGPSGLDSLDQAICAMFRGGAADFVGIVVDADAAPSRHPGVPSLPWAGLAAEVEAMVESAGGVVGDLLLVVGDRYWSYLCRGQGCCPPEGTAIVSEASPIPATATFAGLVALPGRGAVERLLDPAPSGDRERLRPAIDAAQEAARAALGAGDGRADRGDVRALFAAARAAEGSLDGGEADPDVLARYAVALRRVAVRDSVWMAVDDGRLAGDDFWRHLAYVLPEPFDAAPLFLVGWSAWRRGSGALARIAAERCLDSDPGYTAADLLLAALSTAVDPRSMPKLRRASAARGGAQATRTKM